MDGNQEVEIDEAMEKTKQENRKLCERYPFLIPWNRFSGKLITEAKDGGFYPGDPDQIPEYDYEYTELDGLPEGWRRAFGEQMCDEILQALIAEDDLDRWRIVELKEKYGGMRLYDNGHKQDSELPNIVGKYSRISERTCIVCGKPATQITTGWICPFCDDCCVNCAEGRSVPIDEFYGKDEP